MFMMCTTILWKKKIKKSFCSEATDVYGCHFLYLDGNSWRRGTSRRARPEAAFGATISRKKVVDVSFTRKPQYGGGSGTPGDSPGTHGELVPRACREVSESRGRAYPGHPLGGVSPGVGPGLGPVTVDRCHGLPSWMLQF